MNFREKVSWFPAGNTVILFIFLSIGCSQAYSISLFQMEIYIILILWRKRIFILNTFFENTLQKCYKTRITFDKLYITRSSFEVRLSDSYLFTFFCNFFDTAVRIPNLFYNLYISSTDYIRTYDDTFAFLDCVYNCWERQNGCDGCYRSTVLPLSLYMTALFQLSGFSLP